MAWGQHRSYRTISKDGLPVWVDLAIFVLVSVGSIYFYITLIHHNAMMMIHEVFTASGLHIEMIDLDIYTFSMSAFDISFHYNSQITLFYVLLLTVGLMLFLVYQTKIPLNLVFWIDFLLLLTAIFLVYFIFWPTYFPYNAKKYFELYLHAYVGFMLMSFIVFSFSLALTPEKLGKKLFILSGVIAYYFVYSFVRLAATLLLVSQVSVVFVPLMYFTIFYDFILIIYIYTFVLYKNTIKSQGLYHG